MSETNPENSNEVVGKKLESSASTPKRRSGRASDATKAVGDTVKKHAQEVYTTGREHLTAAAKDISDAAAASTRTCAARPRSKVDG